MEVPVRMSRVILTGGAVATAVVLAIQTPGVLKLVLGILWGGVIFVAGLVLLAVALAILGGAPGLARAENEGATESEVIVGPTDNQPLAHARPEASVEHVAGDPPPTASAPDRPVEHSGVGLLG
jgi:hypothetical protein